MIKVCAETIGTCCWLGRLDKKLVF